MIGLFDFGRPMKNSLSMTKKLIGTHSGSFHADEAFACFMLLQTREFDGAEIIRSRDESVLSKCDVVVDVGGIYDPDRHRYDHHQREFNLTMEIGKQRYETRLSSAGLVYKHFGREVISKICSWQGQERDSEVTTVFKKVYESFVEGFDGVDNGVSQYPADLKPKYQENTDIAARVSRLMPWWNQKQDDDILFDRFRKAVDLTGAEFTERVLYTALSWLPAREMVEKVLKNRFLLDESGKILVFDQFLPWKEHLLELEAEAKLSFEDLPLYVVYPDSSSGWRIQAIPIRHGSFENRKPLPESWRGLRDQQLSEISGVSECVFVHATGFIGGNKRRENAVEMARLAVKW